MNLGDQSKKRLEKLMQAHESNRTDTITRALRIYEIIDELDAEGGLYSRTPEGHYYRVRLI